VCLGISLNLDSICEKVLNILIFEAKKLNINSFTVSALVEKGLILFTPTLRRTHSSRKLTLLNARQTYLKHERVPS